MLRMILSWMGAGADRPRIVHHRETQTVVTGGSTIYISEKGQKYHNSRECSGLRMATTTISERSACSLCSSAEAGRRKERSR